jgi:GNAT superfamily N-acetyltransferase
MADTRFKITPARDAADLADARTLILAYADSLGVDLAYQDFAAELAALPGHYAPPAGALLLARGADGTPLGCVALRPMKAPGCCEMKRLYVAPAGRGLGLGRALVEALIVAAERIGYREMRLDSLPFMHDALTLYARTGFSAIAPYYETPIAGTVFLARPLAT